jgi:GT2 family glycosyltransferase
LKLSIIILSYNVRYLLESCLRSVVSAVASIPSEIIVVDNASEDDSVHMILTEFPQVKLIQSQQNLGFAKGNNLGAAEATGTYFLILNPDTIINQEAIAHALAHLESHPTTGAVGLRMVDQDGRFLKESKRGFPHFLSSISKYLGFYRLFPNSRFLNHYYQGFLSENGDHTVEVLSGACMMMPGALYRRLAGFDERFFMYGEDIDLSKRVRDLGLSLQYLGSSTIIHFKGRSARQDSYQHVQNFYQAMARFVDKHYPSRVNRAILKFGIAWAGLFSYGKRKLIRHILPIVDLVLILGSISLAQALWARFWFGQPDYFFNRVFLFNSILFAGIWWASLFLFQVYQSLNQQEIPRAFRAIGIATACILIFYSLWPESFRSSRAVIILSTFFCWLGIFLFRKWMTPGHVGFRVLFIGNEKREHTLHDFLIQVHQSGYFQFFKRVAGISSATEELSTRKYTHVLVQPTDFSQSELMAIQSVSSGHGLEILYTNESFQNLIQDGTIRLGLKRFQWAKKWLHRLACLAILPWGWLRADIRKEYWNLLIGRLHFIGYENPIEPSFPLKKQGLWNYRSTGQLTWSVSDFNFWYARFYSPFYDLDGILRHVWYSS